jgi:hypothetical protein
MTKTVELRTNMAGRLKKIRDGVVYQSVTSVLGELGQNAQRAQATQLNIELDHDRLRFTDNGSGCKDPQTVLELDTSGFGIGFGEGFSSVFTIADILNVKSHDWNVTVNVVDALESGEFNFNVLKASEFKGFHVELIGDKIADHNYDLDRFIQSMAALLPMDVTYNGNKVKRKDILKDDIPQDVNFIYTVDNELFSAALTPSEYDDYSVFFENRFVCRRWISGMTGNVVLKPGAVNLKAPDRRAIVDDQKSRTYQETLEGATADMYREFIQVATNDQLDKYAEKIARFLDVEEYLGYLPMTEDALKVIRKDEEYANMTDEELIAHFGLNAPETKYYGGGSRVEQGENYDPNGWHEATITLGDHRFEGSMKFGSPILEVKRKKGDNSAFIAKLREEENLHKVLWIKSSDADLFSKEIKEYEYHGFAVLTAHNRLYERAFEALGIMYFHDASENIEQKYEFSNVGASCKKEQRIMWMLGRIEEFYGLSNIFRIADIDCHLEHYRNDILVDREHKLVAGCMWESKKDGTKRIYLNRKNLQLPSYRVSNWESGNLTMNDLRMMLKNLEVIAHELAHLLYDTKDNTKEHTDKQSALMKDIADLF